VTPEDAAGSPWAELLAGAAVVYQQAIDKLDVPALILEMPSRRVLAANEAIADVFDIPCEEMLGRRNDELVEFDDLDAMIAAVDALAAGAIDGYRGRRRVTTRKGVTKSVVAWARVIQLGTVRFAAYLVQEVGRHIPTKLAVAWAGPLVVGTADASWRIRRISSDVAELLGVPAMQWINTILLDVIDPDDVPALLDAVRTASMGMTMRHVRLRHRDGSWIPAQCLLVAEGPGPSAPTAFALMPEPEQAAGPPSDRVAELERRLRRIASELRAAGLLDDIETLPTVEAFPQLASLTSRQWQILVRLMRGERVPTIARELYLSPGTVRNHLAAMFERFGVHSQAELIARLRRR
jgi:DNA-binding CsgD family transcriptional regulator